MKENTNGNYSQKGFNPQQNKKYPGYTPDETAVSEYIDADPNSINEQKDAALADKGPIRNPNYHNVNEPEQNNVHTSPSPLSFSQREDGKTLEDFNDTNPKRDVNKEQ